MLPPRPVVIALALLAFPTAAAAEEVPADFSPEYVDELVGFDDFTYDTDWIPADSPIQLRLIAHGGNTVTIAMPGDGVYDWDAGELHFEGAEGAGAFAVDVGFELNAKVRIDIFGIQAETDLLGPYDLAVISDATFTPYLLAGNPERPAQIADATGFVTIAEVPIVELGGIADGDLHIDAAIEVEGSLEGAQIEATVAAPSPQTEVFVTEYEARPLDAGPGPDPDPFAVTGTLTCHLKTAPTMIVKPTLVLEILFVEYEVADIEIPVSLAEVDDDIVFDPILMEFARPEAPPPDTDTDGTDSDATTGDSDSSTSDSAGTTGDDSDTGTSGSGTGTGGPSTTDGDDTTAGPGDTGSGDTDSIGSVGESGMRGEEEGCGCQSGGDAGGLALALLVLPALLRRRGGRR